VGPVLVLCGPGNNGGDGFVVARLLDDAGWPVRVGLLGATSALSGDARVNADRCPVPVAPLSVSCVQDAALIVDALFGIGLSRPVGGVAAAVIDAVNGGDAPCVAVDIPSGIDGDSGAVLGTAIKADVTVTFFRAQPGHYLMPGRAHCGQLVIADIGISDADTLPVVPPLWHNAPPVWDQQLPRPRIDGHKYQRGHALIAGGAVMTGAARLAAVAARRMGAGLTSIAAPAAARPVYAAAEPGNLIVDADDAPQFAAVAGAANITALLVGPGAGRSAAVRAWVLAALATGKPTVIDADGLSAFAEAPKTLFQAISAAPSRPCVLTPHDGEFRRLFDVGGDKVTRTRRAAQQSGAVVVAKGADTVIADAGGAAVINATGTPFLATAGSGDVLAGMITGLLAQGMAPFAAAAAAVWIHGRAAEALGPGLIAEDLADPLGSILATLY
jgi:NAD(P)H-hydrate epimerase